MLNEILRFLFCEFRAALGSSHRSHPRPSTGRTRRVDSLNRARRLISMRGLFHFAFAAYPLHLIMTSSLLPLELRIRILEAQLFGVPSSLLSDPNSPSPTSTSARTTPAITHRIRNVEQCLHQLGESSDGVKRLLEGCTYLSFGTTTVLRKAKGDLHAQS